MTAQLFSIAIITLLGAMLPGPDFAIVVRNSLFHSRKSGFFTSLGISTAILVHMTYCILGLAVVILHSIVLFNLIKYVGASYLIYLGVKILLSKQPNTITSTKGKIKKSSLSNFTSFKQGFFCNLLNPKATLFILSLFTVIIKPGTPIYWELIYVLEILLITIGWFFCLTIILSHPKIKNVLEKAEKYIAKLLGISLIGFGILLAFVKY